MLDALGLAYGRSQAQMQQASGDAAILVSLVLSLTGDIVDALLWGIAAYERSSQPCAERSLESPTSPTGSHSRFTHFKRSHARRHGTVC